MRPFSGRKKFTSRISDLIVGPAHQSASTLKKLPLLSSGGRSEPLSAALKAILCSWTLENPQFWCVFITATVCTGCSSVGQKHAEVHMQPKKILVLAKTRVPLV